VVILKSCFDETKDYCQHKFKEVTVCGLFLKGKPKPKKLTVKVNVRR